MSTHFKASRCAPVLALIAALIPWCARAGEIGTPISANGFTFINFDPTMPGIFAISNANGISNRGHVVVTSFDANGNPANFTGTPARTIALNTGAGAMAFGMNNSGAVVGTQNGAAFFLPPGGTPEALPSPAGATSASGINDKGQIVGQFTTPNGQTPGLFLRNMKSAAVTIYSPFELNIVSAQGINNFGLIVGFYLGADGQDQASLPMHRRRTTAFCSERQIPNVAGEPGATFVFSQLLGVNRRRHCRGLLRRLHNEPAWISLRYEHWDLHVSR